ncbi:MAG: hypothetical protein JNM93_06880 [Bacteriovoracaceae bacterium]|nr:hypothetical protein [Bacteriovoracaceae bacterium]
MKVNLKNLLVNKLKISLDGSVIFLISLLLFTITIYFREHLIAGDASWLKEQFGKDFPLDYFTACLVVSSFVTSISFCMACYDRKVLDFLKLSSFFLVLGIVSIVKFPGFVSQMEFISIFTIITSVMFCIAIEHDSFNSKLRYNYFFRFIRNAYRKTSEVRIEQVVNYEVKVINENNMLEIFKHKAIWYRTMKLVKTDFVDHLIDYDVEGKKLEFDLFKKSYDVFKDELVLETKNELIKYFENSKEIDAHREQMKNFGWEISSAENIFLLTLGMYISELKDEGLRNRIREGKKSVCRDALFKDIKHLNASLDIINNVSSDNSSLETCSH